MRLTVRRSAAIGDVIACTTVAAALYERDHDIVFQCHPHIMPILKRSADIFRVEPASGYCDIDLDGAFERHPERLSRNFYELFFEEANRQLDKYHIGIGVPGLVRPMLFPSLEAITCVNAKFSNLPKPWVGVVPRSHFYKVREVPDYVWKQVPFSGATFFWLGTHESPRTGWIDPKCRDLSYLLDLISAMDLMVTADTGPMHMAVGLGKPLVVVKQANDPMLRVPKSYPITVVSADLDCLNCGKNICPKNEFIPPCGAVDPQRIVSAIHNELERLGYKA